MAKLAISNLAWHKDEDEQIFKMMLKADVLNLEISPFRDSNKFNAEQHLNPYGIQIIALQSLLYRFSSLALFVNEEIREQLFKHMVKLIDLTTKLGAKVLVFGCPKNKLRGDLNYNEANQLAATFFKRLTKHLSKSNICFCLEPTPTTYGADFVRNTKEAIDLIKAVNDDNVKLNFDLGAIKTNEENAEQLILTNAKHIGHVHISEPSLKTIDTNHNFHKKVAYTLQDVAYEGFVSIEMLPQKSNNVQTIQEVLTFVNKIYS